MTLLDAATAAFLAVTVALVLAGEFRGRTSTRVRRVLGLLWVPLAVAFVAKLTSVFAPLVRGAWG